MMPLPFTVTTNATAPLAMWTEIDCDSDLFTPFDAMRIAGPATTLGVPFAWLQLRAIGTVAATLGPAPVFTGKRVSVEIAVQGNERKLTIEAADAAKALCDCAPVLPLAAPAGSLQVFASALCAPFGVTVLATAPLPRITTTSFSATESVWSILEELAHEAQGVIWVDPLGIVRIEQMAAYYAAPPVDTLTVLPAGPAAIANNVTSYRLFDDAGDRFSQVVVRGHGPMRALQGSAATGLCNAPVTGLAPDPEMIALGLFRPRVIDDEDSRTIAQAQAKALREIALRKVRGTKIECEVPGFTTRTGAPWQATQMVMVNIEAEKVAGPYFVAGRRFMQDAQQGSRTRLTLIEPGVL